MFMFLVVCVVGTKKKKTKIIRDTLNPQWTVGDPEIFKLYVIGGKSIVFSISSWYLSTFMCSKIRNNVDKIVLECYDWDRFNTDDRMGMV
jgi:hypothetical protein